MVIIKPEELLIAQPDEFCDIYRLETLIDIFDREHNSLLSPVLVMPRKCIGTKTPYHAKLRAYKDTNIRLKDIDCTDESLVSGLLLSKYILLAGNYKAAAALITGTKIEAKIVRDNIELKSAIRDHDEYNFLTRFPDIKFASIGARFMDYCFGNNHEQDACREHVGTLTEVVEGLVFNEELPAHIVEHYSESFNTENV